MTTIYVADMTNYAGKQTLDRIEERLKKENKKGKFGVVVDLGSIPMRKEFAVDVARMIDSYKCKFINLGEKEEEVDAYIATGYFIKEKLGNVKFGERFKRLVEMSDFPLMIKDNRLKGDELIKHNVIQPISFNNSYFHYNVIKPHLLEPGYLEKACWYENKNIFDKESIHMADLGDKLEGYRFANSEQERTILDVFTGVIDGTLKGFYEVEKKE